MPIVIWILAVGTNLTVVQRVLYTRRHMVQEEGIVKSKE